MHFNSLKFWKLAVFNVRRRSEPGGASGMAEPKPFAPLATEWRRREGRGRREVARLA